MSETRTQGVANAKEALSRRLGEAYFDLEIDVIGADLFAIHVPAGANGK